jgi:hypothetical protein
MQKAGTGSLLLSENRKQLCLVVLFFLTQYRQHQKMKIFTRKQKPKKVKTTPKETEKKNINKGNH